MSGVVRSIRNLLRRALRRRRSSSLRRRKARAKARAGSAAANASAAAAESSPSTRAGTPQTNLGSNSPASLSPTSNSSLSPNTALSSRASWATSTSASASSSTSSTVTTATSSTRASSWAPPSPLPKEAIEPLRLGILKVLEEEGVINAEDAKKVAENPGFLPSKGQPFLWLPDSSLSACFMDYLNCRVRDPEQLRDMLRSPVKIAHGDAAIMTQVLNQDSIVKDLVRCQFQERFYALNNLFALLIIPSRCHVCNDWRYLHCNHCDRCSFGLSLGRCSHCGQYDRQMMALNVSSDNSSTPGYMTSMELDDKENISAQDSEMPISPEKGRRDNLTRLYANRYSGEARILSLPRIKRNLLEKSIESVSQLISECSDKTPDEPNSSQKL